MVPRDRFPPAVVFLALWAGAVWMPVSAGAPQAPPASAELPAFREFTLGVQQYVALHKTVPQLRTTKRRKEIVERQHALAQKIRETRAGARPGDMFTSEISAEFQRVIRSAFQGPDAPKVRRTIREGAPVPGWKLNVNGDYPEHLPLTTVPPTLLLRLPQLPAGMAYRIIAHDFVLEDTEARLIVDFISGVIP